MAALPPARGILLLSLVAGCGAGQTSSDAALPASDAGARDAAPPDPNAPWDDPPAAVPPDGGSYRTTLADCWTDVTCHRAMVVSHGGDWDWQSPYDSRPALVRAVQRGADGIKADLRMTADHVAVITHSSPIQLFESTDCAGKYVEQMTADEVTHCHMLGTQNTFQRVDRLLQWAYGRSIVMFDVKLATDLPAAIQTVVANNGQDNVFLEVHQGDFLNIAVGSPGWDQVHYLVWLDDPPGAQAVIAANHLRQAFMYEMNPTYPGYAAADMTTFIDGTLHPAGVRAFTSTDTINPTVENHQMLFDEGFDVVMTYDLTNALQVRTAINMMRGISPP